MTTFCFDFGNTRKKVAVFEDAKFKDAVVLPNDDPATIQQLIDQYKPQKSILSSVIDHNPAIEELLNTTTKYHKLNHLTKVSFTTPVGKPEDIGADRLALCAGAVRYYSDSNNLIVALGT